MSLLGFSLNAYSSLQWKFHLQMDVLGYCAPHFRKPPSRSVSRKKWLLWDAHVSISTIHGAHTHIHTARTGETSSKYVEIGNPRIHGIDVICLVVTIWLHHIASGCCLRHTQTHSCTEVFTQCFTHRSLYTTKFSYARFTPRVRHTQNYLHTEAVEQKSFFPRSFADKVQRLGP